MKKDIHPKYHKEAKISCACGNELTTGSTQEIIKVELCSVCHPFYTGKQRLVDTERRVEKFKEKLALTKDVAQTRKGKKAKIATRAKSKKSEE